MKPRQHRSAGQTVLEYRPYRQPLQFTLAPREKAVAREGFRGTLDPVSGGRRTIGSLFFGVLEDEMAPKPPPLIVNGTDILEGRRPGASCPTLPANLGSQADVDAWNAAHPECPLPSYAQLCDVGARPTEREAVIRWNAERPECTPIPVPEAPASGGDQPTTSSAGPLILGAAVLVAAVVLLKR